MHFLISLMLVDEEVKAINDTHGDAQTPVSVLHTVLRVLSIYYYFQLQ